ncbi:MAG: hypothetical protein LC792_15365 [Actinobacteria bacterium]|nr:hypothetical protein [Actinomycetota bacterium]
MARAPARRAPAKKAPAKRAPARKKAAPAKPAPPANNDAAVEAEIRKNYGFEAFLLDNPETKAVLLQASREGWDQARTQGALQATAWWKQHSDNQRSWAELKANDPATAAARVSAQSTAIAAAAKAAGVDLSPDRLAAMAESATENQWSAPQLQAALAAEYHYDPTQTQKAAAAGFVEQFRRTAADYFVPVSDQAMGNYVGQALSGSLDNAGFTEQMRNFAKQAYSDTDTRRRLDQGETMQQIADPYRQMAAKELGIDPNSVDFQTPKWGVALQIADPKTGELRRQTPQEWQTMIRSQPSYGWANSTPGKQTLADGAMNLVQAIRGQGAI